MYCCESISSRYYFKCEEKDYIKKISLKQHSDNRSVFDAQFMTRDISEINKLDSL